jgi:hypothetical protein
MRPIPQIFTVVLVFLSSFISGCILNDYNREKAITYINGDYRLNYTVVESINYSDVETRMENDGYNVRLFPDEYQPPGPGYTYGIRINKTGVSYFSFRIEGWMYNNTSNALLCIIYAALHGPFHRESQVNETKEFMKAETDTICSYIGISIGWPAVRWSVSLSE